MVLVPPGVSEHDLGRDLVHETLETLIIGTDVLKLMMEDPRFGTLTYMIGRYPHDVMVEGYKAQSKLYNMTAAMIAGMDMPGAQPAVEEIISCRPDVQTELDLIENGFAAIVKDHRMKDDAIRSSPEKPETEKMLIGW